MRSETKSQLDEAAQDAQQQREQILADAKQEADHYREQARRAVNEATQRRIGILERLMGVYRDLEEIPATLESAYREQTELPEVSVVASSEQTNGVTTG
jgi:hypothetical protein